MKKLVRIFMTSFFISILLVSTAFGLLWVAKTSKSQRGGDTALSLTRQSPHSLSLVLIGEEYDLSLSKAENVAEFLTQWGVIAVPRGIRLVLQWGGAVKYALIGDTPSLPEPEYKNAALV